jgi:hypothetical protein
MAGVLNSSRPREEFFLSPFAACVGALETPRESAVLWTDLSRSGLVGACLSATVEAISRLGTNRKNTASRDFK